MHHPLGTTPVHRAVLRDRAEGAAATVDRLLLADQHHCVEPTVLTTLLGLTSLACGGRVAALTVPEDHLRTLAAHGLIRRPDPSTVELG